MKGGMQFFDRQPPDTGYISLYGDGDGDEQNKLQYTKKTVQTHSKLKDGTHLKFTLYNIEPFHEYEKTTFDLSNLLGDDINSIEHLYLCGFLTKISRRELFIKKGKVGEEGNKEKHFKAIGKTLYKLLSENIKIKTEKIKDKIQIILAHSKEKNTLCIIFNMSNMHSNYYKSLKKSLPYTLSLFSDEKNLEKKIEKSQLENLIEFTNEKLVIKPIADSSKTRFLLGLLFPNAKGKQQQD